VCNANYGNSYLRDTCRKRLIQSALARPKLFGGTGCDGRFYLSELPERLPRRKPVRENYIRLPGYMNVDFGMAKSFYMPWSEKQELQFRWDVFNVANYQPFGQIDGSRTGLRSWTRSGTARTESADETGQTSQLFKGNPRVFQIGARFSF